MSRAIHVVGCCGALLAWLSTWSASGAFETMRCRTVMHMGAVLGSLQAEAILAAWDWGWESRLLDSAMTVNPPNSPKPTAAKVLPMAKSTPSAPDVITNIAGSMIGDDSQNAMTADSGVPIASRAATKGITSQEQNGASPPTSAASTTIRLSRP